MDDLTTSGGGQLPDETKRSEKSAAAGAERTVPRWVRRALVVAGGASAFALVGSIINPEWSSADDEWKHAVGISGGGSNSAGPGARGRMPIVEPASLIGTLESREYRILIHHGDPVPLYTVCMPDGRVLREKLEAGDVYREFPGIDLRQMLVDPPGDGHSTGPLMLVYPMD